MNDTDKIEAGAGSRFRPAPWFALAVCLSLVYAVYSELRRHTDRAAAQYFTDLVEQQRRHSEDQIQGYSLLFRSMAGVARTEIAPTPGVWRNFEAELDIEDHFPGMDAFGGARFVEAVEDSERRPRGDARIYPQPEPGARALPVIFITPGSETNRAMHGLDLLSIPSIEKEVWKTLELDDIRVTDWVEDASDPSGIGFWLLHPIPAREDSGDREARGVFFMKFGLSRFIEHTWILPENYLGIQLLDGPGGGAVFDSHGRGAGAEFRMVGRMRVYGDQAYTRYYSLPAFESAVRSDSPEIAASAGTLLSLLLFGVLMRLGAAQERAERLALARKETIDQKTIELQNTVTQLRAIINSEPECIKTVAGDGTLLEMNPAGLALIQADDPKEALGANVFDLVHDEDREPFIELHNRVMQGGQGELSFRVNGLKGDLRNMETRSVPLRDENGKIQSVLSITREVSARLKAERDLKRSLKLLEGIHAAQSKFIIPADIDALFRSMLDILLQITECEVGFIAEVIKRDDGSPILRMQASSNEVWNDEARGLYRGNEGVGVELEHPENLLGKALRSGEPVVVNDLSTLLRPTETPEGHPEMDNFMGLPLHFQSELVGMIGIANRAGGFDSDLQEFLAPFRSTCATLIASFRHELRAQADREQLRLAQFSLDHAVEAIFFLTAEGRVSYLNEAAEALLGGDRESGEPLLVSEMIPEFAGEEWTKWWNETKRSGALERESALLSRDGTRIPIGIGANFLEFSDEEICCVFVRDLREQVAAEEKRTELERQLRQSSKMEAIGTLAGGIAHDFNNILAAVVGFTELAKDEPANEAIREYLGEIETASNRARSLVSQILTFSRDQAIERQPVRFSTVVSEAVKLLRAAIPATVEIRTEIERQDPLILANPTQIHQIVMNLGTNAQQAMDEHGIIEVLIEVVELRDRDQLELLELSSGRYVKLTFRDNGSGIPDSVFSRVFDPFFTTKAPGKGTGLGLSVVHGIVRQHDAGIEVGPGLTGGTEFRLYFPALDSPDAETVVVEDETPRGDGELIVLADDECPLLRASARLLERLGYRVRAFDEPAEALEFIETSGDEVSLLLTDLCMPGMDGLELAGRVAETRPELPVILVSGYGDAFDLDSCALPSIRSYLDKPVRKGVIARALREILAGEAVADGCSSWPPPGKTV